MRNIKAETFSQGAGLELYYMLFKHTNIAHYLHVFPKTDATFGLDLDKASEMSHKRWR